MIDSLRNLLRPVMAIAGHRETFCGGQHIVMGSLHKQVRPALTIDGHVSRPIVVHNA